MCATLHVLWSLVYIGCGAIQLVVGIFFLVALPFLRLGSNVFAGGWVRSVASLVHQSTSFKHII